MSTETRTIPDPETVQNAIVEAIAATLKDLMYERGVSGAMVGRAALGAQQAFSRRMLGEVRWTVPELFAVAVFLEVPFSAIVPDSLADLFAPAPKPGRARAAKGGESA